jgi:hypothetical protein
MKNPDLDIPKEFDRREGGELAEAEVISPKVIKWADLDSQ